MDFREKSRQSISNAEFLHKQSLYLSVPHCAYYSTYQAILNILKFNPDIEVIEVSQDERTESHSATINKTFLALNQRGVPYREYRDYQNKIGQLKRLRHDADYKEVPIDSSKSEFAIFSSKQITKFLNLKFSI